MNSATRTALVTGEMKDCMAPAGRAGGGRAGRGAHDPRARPEPRAGPAPHPQCSVPGPRARRAGGRPAAARQGPRRSAAAAPGAAARGETPTAAAPTPGSVLRSPRPAAAGLGGRRAGGGRGHGRGRGRPRGGGAPRQVPAKLGGGGGGGRALTGGWKPGPSRGAARGRAGRGGARGRGSGGGGWSRGEVAGGRRLPRPLPRAPAHARPRAPLAPVRPGHLALAVSALATSRCWPLRRVG